MDRNLELYQEIFPSYQDYEKLRQQRMLLDVPNKAREKALAYNPFCCPSAESFRDKVFKLFHGEDDIIDQYKAPFHQIRFYQQLNQVLLSKIKEIRLNDNLYHIIRYLECKKNVIKDSFIGDVCIDAKDRNGRTALINAVLTCKDVSIVEMLLKYKADVNLVDNSGCSALHYAVFREDMSIAKLLFRYGARPCKDPIHCCFIHKQTMRLLVGYLALQHVQCKVSLGYGLIPMNYILEIKDLDYVEKADLIKVRNTCFQELYDMNFDFVNRSFTMDKFLLNRLFVNRYNFKEPDNILESFICSLYAGLYKIYGDLILSSLNRDELLHCFSAQFFFYALPSGKVSCLNKPVLQNIGMYLPNGDLLNVLRANLNIGE